MANKTWMKMYMDFMQRPKIKKLRSVAGGDTYFCIYLSMGLSTIESGGILKYEGLEDTLAKELALILDAQQNDVEFLLAYMEKYKMIEQIGDDEYMLPEFAACIGKESESADRVRRYRERKKKQQEQIENQSVTAHVLPCNDCNNDVTLHVTPVTNGEKVPVTKRNDIKNKNREEEIEKEKEVEVEKDIQSVTLDKEQRKKSTTTIAQFDDDMKQVIDSYSDNIHPLSGQIELDKLTDDVERYSAKWVLAAIQRAVIRNKRSLGYIEGILNNWQTDGFDPEGKKKADDDDKFAKPKYGF